ncbi:MAG: filamentous hemagglutinin N-terminal domain-containing protein [Spirulina sp.]
MCKNHLSGFRLWIPLASCIGAVLTVTSTFAQISNDGTLGTNVTGNPNFTITGGTTRGTNLFHSFSEFSVPTGGSAVFNNSTAIQNIFSRVTGGNISNIDGLIEAQGTANLFLLNPAGIIFGSGAQLRLGGSFFATTADSIVFADGTSFSAVDPAPPLLTISAPVGLVFGNNPGAIEVQGNGHSLQVSNPNKRPTRDRRWNPNSVDLRVGSGETLALIGGEINLVNGELAASSGHIELGSVTSGTVQLSSDPSGWNFNYDAVQGFGDIDLSQKSLLYAGGSSGGGSIHLTGHNISFTDRSLAWIENRGSLATGDIRVDAQDLVSFTGEIISRKKSNPSGLINETVGDGNSGNVEINTARLELVNGGAITSRTLGAGISGDVVINASESIDTYHRESQIVGFVSGTGNGGTITLSTRRFSMYGGFVTNSNYGSGNAGELTINADLIDVTADSTTRNALIAATTFDTGDAADLVFNTRLFRVTDKAKISSVNFAYGNGGTITINASEAIELRGDPDSINSNNSNSRINITSSSESKRYLEVTPEGDAGSIIFNTPRLEAMNNVSIRVIQEGHGSAGDVQINADSVYLDGQSHIAGYSLLDGKSGNINVSTDRLQITGDSYMTVSNLGTGDAGNLNIQANSVLLEEGNLSTLAVDGKGGKIDLRLSDNLVLRQGSSISAATTGTGDAGDVQVQANSVLVDGSSIEGTTLSGSGGNISLQASDRLQVTNGGNITASSLGTGNAGDVQVQANSVLVDGGSIKATTLSGGGGNVSFQVGDRLEVTNGGNITVSSLGTGNAGDLRVQANSIRLERGNLIASTRSGEGGNITLQLSELLLMRRGSLISAEAGGTGNGGNITINAPFIVAVPWENSDIIANAFEGNGGNINITTLGIFGLEYRDRLTEFSDISASSEFGVSGTVTISNPNVNPAALNAELQGNVLDPNQQVARGCDAAGSSRFIATGRGGIPENPVDPRSGTNTWSDVRDLSTRHQPPVTRDALSLPKSHQLPDSQPLVEATGWRARADGTVEIYAEANIQPEALATTNCAGDTSFSP